MTDNNERFDWNGSDCWPGGVNAVRELVVRGSVSRIPPEASRRTVQSVTIVNDESSELSIRDRAFEEFKELLSVQIPRCIGHIGKGVFFGAGKLQSVDIDKSRIEEISRQLFQGCENLKTICLPSTVVTIGESAFEGCLKLESIDMKENVEQIGKRAFAKCVKLKQMVFPNSCCKIGVEAFDGCSSLESVDFQTDKLKELPDEVFFDCSSLTIVEIPSGVEKIGKGAFQGCTALVSIIVPELFQDHGLYCYCKCPVLSAIELSGSEEVRQFHQFGSYLSTDEKSVSDDAQDSGLLSDRSYTGNLPDMVEKPPGRDQSVALSSPFQDAAFDGDALFKVKSIRGRTASIGTDLFSDQSNNFEETETTDTEELKLDGDEEVDPAPPNRLFSGDIEESMNSLRNIQDVLFDHDDILWQEKDSLFGRFDCLPLHRSCYKDSTKQIQQTLSQRGLNADSKDCLDMTPLHLLATNRSCTADLVKTLMEMCPGAVNALDKREMCPLHYACFNRHTNLECIKLLSDGVLLKDSKPVLMKPNMHNDTPFAIALRCSRSEDILDYLFERQPRELESSHLRRSLCDVASRYVGKMIESFKDCPSKILSPAQQHGWVEFVHAPTDGVVVTVESFLLECPPGAVRTLAYAKNWQGKTAIDLAHQSLGTIMMERLLFVGRYNILDVPLLRKSGTSIVVKAVDVMARDEYAAYFQKQFAQGTEEQNVETNDTILKELYEEFVRDRGRSGPSKSKFVDLCVDRLDGGRDREVVIKFIKNRRHFLRESESRIHSHLDPKYVAEIINQFDATATNDAKNERFRKEIASTEVGGVTVQEYRHAVVMRFAERDLYSILRYELAKDDDMEQIRSYARDLAEALAHIHKNGLIHGDVRLPNAVRQNGHIALIDMDASARIEKEYAGAKFCSGLLPPNMIHRLDDEMSYQQYVDYFKKHGESSPPWERIKPLVRSSDCSYVAKTFVFDRESKTGMGKTTVTEVPRSSPSLPYEFVKASPQIDMWAYGAVLYTLCTGSPLFKVDQEDDLVEWVEMKEIHEWSNDKLSQKLKIVQHREAKRLLEKLLSPEPQYESMNAVLDHPFLGGEGDMEESQDSLYSRLTVDFQRQLKHLQGVLLTGIYEATEVQTPTAFVILEERLPDPNYVVGLEDVLNTSGEGIDWQKVPNEKFQAGKAVYDKAMKWTSRSIDMVKSVAAGDADSIFNGIKDSLKDFASDREMYFYLVDELTGKPVRAKGYPIEITTRSDRVAKLMPLMIGTMRGMSLYNGCAGIARMFGVPLPGIPEEWRKKCQGTVELMKQESSVQKFGVLHKEAMDQKGNDGDNSTPKSCRGQALLELKDFLTPKEGGKPPNYAGLRRHYNEETGIAMWSLCDDPEEFQEELRKRQEEREEELRHQSAFLSSARDTDTEISDLQTQLPETPLAPLATREVSDITTSNRSAETVISLQTQLHEMKRKVSDLTTANRTADTVISDLQTQLRDAQRCTCEIL